ncbi:MAG: SH3 domain-containing protein [Thiothrix sp.]|nr:SH3 domain-containing protein [Thiothrix sp.]HPQ95722.1 SH3 domain-containing protein [Thiolinea sp.]
MKCLFPLRTAAGLLFMLLVLALPAHAAYRVIGVDRSDTLNMRAAAGVTNTVVAELPPNATGVVMLGEQQKVGRTVWVRVRWKQQVGWVSLAYLQPEASAPPAGRPAPDAPSADMPVTPVPVPARPEGPQNAVAVKRDKEPGMWILECGGRSPYWKVEVLPEWINGRLGDHLTGMPITHKRQTHGNYRNVALETEIRGANRWNQLRMTLTYNRSCYSTLTRTRMAFSVEGQFNDQMLQGCCRSLQVQ